MDYEYIKHNATASGKCGEDLHWYRLGAELYIDGTGSLYAPDCMDWGIVQKDLQEDILHLEIGEGCELIDVGTFWNWKRLRSLTLPASFTRLGYLKKSEESGDYWVEGENGIDELLYECPNLEMVEVHEDNPIYTTMNGVLFDKKMRKLLRYPQGKEGAYTIPCCVTIIGDGAFEGCVRLSDITISENVTVIEDGAFEGCTGLSQIVLPSGITKVTCSAFYGCSGLISVKIPERVSEIGDVAFSGCTGLTSVAIPDGVTSIAKRAFKDVPHIIYHGPAQSEDNWGALSRS